MKKLNHYFKVAIIAMLAATLLSLNLSQITYAGSNGQQLRIKVKGCQLIGNPGNSGGTFMVTVKGKNQNGKVVTWTSGDFVKKCEFETNGWWWVGKVTVTAYRKLLDPKPQELKLYPDVPKKQLGNWMTVEFGPWK